MSPSRESTAEQRKRLRLWGCLIVVLLLAATAVGPIYQHSVLAQLRGTITANAKAPPAPQSAN
jgi:hypothetical protein